VLGGYGAVGTEVTSQLRAGGDDYLVAGRDPARADQVVNLHQSGAATHRTALAGVDVVANAAGVEDPALAAIAAERGAAFVDITATLRLRRGAGAPAAAPAGPGQRRPAPRLTNLLAAAVHHTDHGPIDIELLVGAGSATAPRPPRGPTGCSASASGIRARPRPHPDAHHRPAPARHGRARAMTNPPIPPARPQPDQQGHDLRLVD
jgi:hypothetical protein